MKRGLAGLSLWFSLTSVASAQPLGISVETIEWMAADSPVIVRGVIVDLVHTDEPDREQRDRDELTIKVQETLKGTHQLYHTVVIHSGYPFDTNQLAHWMKTNQELLLFLVDSKPFPEPIRQHPHTLRQAWSQGLLVLKANAKTLADGALYAYTLDLRELAEPKEILQVTRAAITAAEGQRLTSTTIQTSGGPGWITRTVPVDERLEKQALQWTQVKSWEHRKVAAQVLELFYSEANVAVLRQLLTDPGFYDVTGLQETPDHRYYPVREAAAETLKALAVEFPPPVIREPLPAPPEATP